MTTAPTDFAALAAEARRRKQPMDAFAVRLPATMVEWIDARATDTRLTRSDIIRLIIDDAIDREEETA